MFTRHVVKPLIAMSLLVSIPTVSTNAYSASDRSELRDAQDELMRYRAKEKNVQRRLEQQDAVERQLFLERYRNEQGSKQAEQEQVQREADERLRQFQEQQLQAKQREKLERQRNHDDTMEIIRRDNERSNARAKAEVEERDRYNETMAKERARPENKLKELYASYIGTSKCYDSRFGKLYLYIDDNDLKEAKQKTGRIEAKILEINPRLNREQIWSEASKFEDNIGWIVSKYDLENHELTENGKSFCNQSMADIRQMYQTYFPDAGVIQKDF